jgi:hypothetical protein
LSRVRGRRAPYFIESRAPIGSARRRDHQSRETTRFRKDSSSQGRERASKDLPIQKSLSPARAPPFAPMREGVALETTPTSDHLSAEALSVAAAPRALLLAVSNTTALWVMIGNVHIRRDRLVPLSHIPSRVRRVCMWMANSCAGLSLHAYSSVRLPGESQCSNSIRQEEIHSCFPTSGGSLQWATVKETIRCAPISDRVVAGRPRCGAQGRTRRNLYAVLPRAPESAGQVVTPGGRLASGFFRASLRCAMRNVTRSRRVDGFSR